MDQVDQGDRRGHEAAYKFHQARANQIADAFDVAHDARDQHAGFVGVVERDGQAPDVGLHLAAQLGDHALRGLREKLRKRERRKSLNERGCQHRKRQRRKKTYLTVQDDVIHEVFGGSGEHQAGDAVNGH